MMQLLMNQMEFDLGVPLKILAIRQNNTLQVISIDDPVVWIFLKCSKYFLKIIYLFKSSKKEVIGMVFLKSYILISGKNLVRYFGK